MKRALPLLLSLLLCSCQQKEPERQIDSVPSGAGLWNSYDELVGNTPMPPPANGQYTLRYPGYKELPCNFVGSIALCEKAVLQEAAEVLGITIGTIIKDPMEGLVKYHSTEA